MLAVHATHIEAAVACLLLHLAARRVQGVDRGCGHGEVPREAVLRMAVSELPLAVPDRVRLPLTA